MPLLVSPLFFLQTGHQNPEADGMTLTTSHSGERARGYAPRAEASAWAPGWEGGRVGHVVQPGVVPQSLFPGVPESWGVWGGESSPAADSGVWGRSWEHSWSGFHSETPL